MAKKRKKEEKIDFKYNIKQYLELLKRYKLLFFSLMFVILVVESTYVIDKFILKVIIDGGTEFLAGALQAPAYIQILTSMILIYVAVILVRTITKWSHIHFINRLDGKIMVDLKRKFFNHILHLDYNFHTTHKTGSLISRLVRAGRAIETTTDVLVFNFSPLVFQMIVSGSALFFFDKLSALVVFLTIAIFLTYSLIINYKQQFANLRANDAEDFEKANISDIFTNIDSIKYFGKEHRIKKRFEKITDITRFLQIRAWDYYRWVDAGQTFILGVGVLALIYFPVVKILNHQMTIGDLVFIFTVFTNFYGPLFSFVQGMRNFYRAMADFESLFQYGKIENAIPELPHAKALKVRRGTIELKNVSFSYKKRKILPYFNLKIKENEKVALVGPSGGGKTTLVRLLYRMYDVDNGEILVDGKNIKDFKQESLRSELSVVPQECVLFDDTIYNNIAFSNPTATRNQVMKPDKEKTIVGERGVKLSGGEKQRVSIARALLADKKILVLDEATSSLDSETEHEIQKDLKKLMQGRTAIMIAHRLSTIMQADTIIVLAKGKIIQKGTHKQLIKQKGLYKKLWNLQKRGYIK